MFFMSYLKKYCLIQNLEDLHFFFILKGLLFLKASTSPYLYAYVGVCVCMYVYMCAHVGRSEDTL